MENYKSLYFIGAGGIGMSALIRYFLAKGYPVAGYDKTPSPLTEELIKEGAQIVYDENPRLIPSDFKDPKNTLIVYTPAVPESHAGMIWFKENGFEIVKRARLLGMITRTSKGLCFAGTHGKTTTSSMAAHIFAQSPIGCNAFLGGILKNYGSNLILSDHSDLTVIEADEYDRSFHQLSPYMAVITAADPDHLDIYGNEDAYLESFRYFTTLIRPGGVLIIKKGIKIRPDVQNGVTVYHYSMNDGGDFYAQNIRIGNGEIFIEGLRIGEYTVYEVSDSVSSGYILPADKQVTIKVDETATVEMHNELRETPKTGDDFNPALWIGLAAVSVLGAGVLGFVGFKNKKKKED